MYEIKNKHFRIRRRRKKSGRLEKMKNSVSVRVLSIGEDFGVGWSKRKRNNV